MMEEPLTLRVRLNKAVAAYREAVRAAWCVERPAPGSATRLVKTYLAYLQVKLEILQAEQREAATP